MAILAAAEDGAVDPAAGDVDDSAAHIGPGVEEYALVALAGTVEVAGDGVCVGLGHGAGNTEGGVAAEVDCAKAAGGDLAVAVVGAYIGHFVAAVDRGEYVAAGDVDRCIAIDGACRLEPLAGGVGEVARAAAEDAAVEGVAVRAGGSGTVGALRVLVVVVSVVVGEGVEGGIGAGVGPAVALVERGMVGIYPFGVGVCAVEVARRVGGAGGIPSAANLSALDGDMGVGEHMSVLRTAKDRALDERAAAMVGLADNDLGAVDKVEVFDDGVGLDIADNTLAAAEDHAAVHGHLEHRGAHAAGGDFDACAAGAGLAGCGEAGGVAGVDTHRGHLAAAIYVALDPEGLVREIARGIPREDLAAAVQAGRSGVQYGAVHLDERVGGDQAGIGVVVAAAATAEDIVVDMAAHQNNLGVLAGRVGGLVHGQVAGAVDVVNLEAAGAGLR